MAMSAPDQNGYHPAFSPPGAIPVVSGRAPLLVSNIATAAIRIRTAAVAIWYGRNGYGATQPYFFAISSWIFWYCSISVLNSAPERKSGSSALSLTNFFQSA
jgi:hypothetical protein